MNNLVKTTIAISDLVQGMTVEYQGQLHTVNKNSVTKGFCGYAFNGDASSKTITRVQFKVPTNKGYVLR